MTTNDFGFLSAKAPAYPMNHVSIRSSRLAALSRKLGISGSSQGEPFTLPQLDSGTSLPSSGSRSTDPSMPCNAMQGDPVTAEPPSFNISQLEGLKEDLHTHFGQRAEDPSWDPDIDLNQNGRIDVRDKRLARDAQLDYKTLIRENYGKTTSDTDWDPDADLNNDGRVDIRDRRLVRDLLV